MVLVRKLMNSFLFVFECLMLLHPKKNLCYSKKLPHVISNIQLLSVVCHRLFVIIPSELNHMGKAIHCGSTECPVSDICIWIFDLNLCTLCTFLMILMNLMNLCHCILFILCIDKNHLVAIITILCLFMMCNVIV